MLRIAGIKLGTPAVVLLLVFYALIKICEPAKSYAMQNETVAVDSGLTVVFGGGGNSGIIIGDSTVVVIDTKMGESSEELYRLAKEKAGTKPIIVINTHYHGDHTSGNKYFKGSKIYIGNYEKEFLAKNLDSMNLPTDYVKDSLQLDVGNEIVRLYDLGRAHTWDDMVVYLEKHNVLFTGDLIFNKINPVLKSESGAKVSSWIKKLDLIINRWSECKIVPGHGKIGDIEMVKSMRQYFIDMTEAAVNPEKQKSLTAKYSDWQGRPGWNSAENTVDYIKKTDME
jgi:cyclase